MSTSDTFSPSLLERVLAEQLELPADVPLRVAYSGGLDSHVLLHALASLRARTLRQVSAIHVDHGLQPQSGQWAEHCERVCRALDVPCAVERVRVTGMREHGLEDAARRARYAVFARLLAPGDVLLTAHQRDDQAETLLLQLLRGAGVHGLAAMPTLVPFARARLARPLLAFPRAALAAYAGVQRLDFIEDGSNRDTRFARNFLRARVLPVLTQRWPEAAAQLVRAARHSAQAVELLDEIADADLTQCNVDSALRISVMQTLSPGRQANLLRYWLRRRGVRAPAEPVLSQILGHVRQPPRSRHACVRWSDAEARLYRDTLTLSAPTPEPENEWEAVWDPAVPLTLPGTDVRLCARASVGKGLAQARLQHRPLRVRLRRGGERCRLPGHAHRHKLKKLLQAAGIAPWERARLPLVYVDGELAAVADRWVCEPYAAHAGEPSYELIIVDSGPAIWRTHA